MKEKIQLIYVVVVIFRPISYVKAFKTNTIIVQPPSNTPESRNQVEKYFADRSLCGANRFLSIQQVAQYMLFVYSNEQDCQTILAREHSLNGTDPLKVSLSLFYRLF